MTAPLTGAPRPVDAVADVVVDVVVIGGGQAGLAAGYPYYPGRDVFRGRQAHTATYPGPDPFRGMRVVVVGGGNSAAQILAEVSTVADATWVTLRPPRLLPDEVDGRSLFDLATRRARFPDAPGIGDLGDIVAVPPVREALRRGALKAEPMFSRLTQTGVAWADGTALACDAIIWCTGFRPALSHLASLKLRGPGGTIPTDGTRALGERRLHLLGYGDWTGPASATLIGAGRSAKAMVAEIVRQL
ncbi:pyridine nucleotide-disulfide oxidoreductase [Planomonospora sphaerica]|uniref:Pyridine nucleotide-disulfide oxidoreductase n=1 Tax=Planomonospora sphaerica TaxID=161355 RepID=A0A161LYS2_9ACTN|nr:hypothetical protein [Planomonospora sphaerica]GAT71049.1 pyridine nucleotide-disulfide oxidoreductase [Planomonospora sphaerica]